ncbi:MAG TPA: SDR family NAD(P)-dependent oxidoreductase, partial [Methylomirabilota bacterium]|nr:SDR family NAD(P)-dependent oxidoreductase [Methylomirabilota bacterium]
MNKIDLAGRKAVVTGGARGIGLAIAERLMTSGAEVSLWDVDAAALQAAAKELAAHGRAHQAAVDVTDPAAVAKAAEAAAAQMGRIDILINNAGISGMNKPTWEYPVEEWRRVLDINLSGPFLCSRAVVPGMIARKYGRIVSIASIAGKEGNPNAVAYSASKAGLIGLTKSL